MEILKLCPNFSSRFVPKAFSVSWTSRCTAVGYSNVDIPIALRMIHESICVRSNRSAVDLYVLWSCKILGTHFNSYFKSEKNIILNKNSEGDIELLFMGELRQKNEYFLASTSVLVIFFGNVYETRSES